MTDPADALDNTVSWWDDHKFMVGWLIGFLSALMLVWMAK